MKRAMVVAAALGLAGCVSPERQATNAPSNFVTEVQSARCGAGSATVWHPNAFMQASARMDAYNACLGAEEVANRVAAGDALGTTLRHPLRRSDWALLTGMAQTCAREPAADTPAALAHVRALGDVEADLRRGAAAGRSASREACAYALGAVRYIAVWQPAGRQ